MAMRPTNDSERRIGADRIKVEKYKQTRFWAVRINGQLLAITVYKKGALAIREFLVLRGMV